MTEQERGPSTMNNLDELERLLEAATPGPWRHSALGAGNHEASPDGQIATIYRREDAALIFGLRNAASDLIAAARRAEALESIVKVLVDATPSTERCIYCGWSRGDHQSKCVVRAARATLAGEGAPR